MYKTRMISIHSLSALPASAKELLQICEGEKIFAFFGEMGVGKTTLIKAICQCLGVTNTVTSPSFSIVNEYQSAQGEKIFHFDFYRIQSVNEAYDLGYEDYFYSDSYCFIEWPEKIAELLPGNYVKVVLTKNGEEREIRI